MSYTDHTYTQIELNRTAKQLAKEWHSKASHISWRVYATGTSTVLLVSFKYPSTTAFAPLETGTAEMVL